MQGGGTDLPLWQNESIHRVKAFAILSIIWLHYFGMPMQWHTQWIPSSQFVSYWIPFSLTKLVRFAMGFGYLGVNLFVISSGFGLQSSLQQKVVRPSYLQFLRGRYSRLLPLAFFATAVVWLIKVILLSESPNSGLLINMLPFLAGCNLFSDATFYPPINGELWFLGMIIQLYLLFPFLTRLLDDIGPRRFLIFLFMISAIFRLVCVFWLRHLVVHAAYGWSLGRLFEFGFGMCAARSLRDGRSLPRWWSLGLLLFWGYFWWWSYPFADVLLGVGLFTSIWNGGGDKFAPELFRYLSTRSYALFLVHHPVIWVFQKLGAQNTLAVESLAGFGLLLFFVTGLAEVLDTMVASPARLRLAAACVCPLVFWAVYSTASIAGTPEQVEAVQAILRLGGSVQREGAKFGEIVAVQMEGPSFNDSHSRSLLVFPHVRKISFFNAAITDESIVQVMDLKHVSALGLQGTKITDKSLSLLATIPTLKYVWLSRGESLSEEKIRHLQEIRPDLKVYY